MASYPLHSIILAAGAGQRLGYPKALLKLKEQLTLPLICQTFKQAGCKHLSVVIRPEHEDYFIDLGFGAHELVINPSPQQGRTSSLLCALKRVGHDHNLLIHSCDIPLISSDAVRKLINAWKTNDVPQQSIARFVSPGGKGGHPLLVGCGHLQSLLGFKPDQPLRELLVQNPDKILNVTHAGDPGPFLGINTTEQLALVESLLDNS
ncbi:MAG: NTP transferase domain-containing protein [Planctomycetota bacterium]|nr:NTP transferase domain-containing protein [Planctomycetota bacterium]